MESPDHPALEDRPEAFNRLSVNDASDVFALALVNGAERVFVGQSTRYPAHLSVQSKLTLCETASRTKAVSVSLFMLPMTRATTLPLRRTAPTTMALSPMPVPPPFPPPRLVFMPLFCLTADKGFVYFDNSAELARYLPSNAVRILWHILQAVL